jgi:hypothetical protein
MAFSAFIIFVITSIIIIPGSANNGIFKQCLKTTFDYENEMGSCYRAWGLIKPIICVDNSTATANNNRTMMFCPVSQLI